MTFKSLTKETPVNMLYDTIRQFRYLLEAHNWEECKHYRRLNPVFSAPTQFSIQVKHIEKKPQQPIQASTNSFSDVLERIRL